MPRPETKLRLPTRAVRLLMLLAVLVVPASLHAQDLGFVNGIFGRVHRLSLFVHALDPKEAPILDKSGKGCITLSLCGAGVRVMIDLDTRSDYIDLELGLGAGYLRALQGKTGDSLDIRGALRTLPVISTQATLVAGKWVNPYFVGSFGLVDIWNGRAHNAEGKQSDLRAATFEYGISLGLAVRPPNTNGRALFEAGYRARTFASIGYGFTDAIGDAWPRQLDLSGWQLSAGWQFDLRPIAKSPDYVGSYVLSRVDGAHVPLVLEQVRGSDGNIRREIMQAWLDLERKPRTYRLVVIMRESVVNSDGVAQTISYRVPVEERGLWHPSGSGVLEFTQEESGNSATGRAERIEDELVLQHPTTGRRLHFRRVR